MPEIVWPPIPSDQAASLMAMLHYMNQSQWWSPESLLSSQLQQAQVLLKYARQTTVFYKSRLAGFDIDRITDSGSWLEIPLLSRNDLQSGGDSLLSQRIPKNHGDIYKTQTSGSTGQNVVVYGTALTQHFWNALTIRDHCWHDRSLDGVHAIIRVLENAPKGGMTNSDWGTPFNLIWKTGSSAVLSLLTDVKLQFDWLRQVNPRYLLTYPSNLSALLELFVASGEKLPGLAQVRTIGETLTPELREQCLSILGVPIVDIYSSQEVGYIALQCPSGDCYHIQAENLLVEVLDDNNMPCKPGMTGKVVVTSLHNFAYPLIRYVIGDYAEVAEQCTCGRGLPAIRRILGRRRNLLTLPGGERFWPIFGVRKFRDVAPVSQYQVVQTALDCLDVRLVVDNPLTADQEKLIHDIIIGTIGFPMKVNFSYPATIQVVAGKHEEFRSEV